MNDIPEIVNRAREAGAKAGMIDPSDLDVHIDVVSLRFDRIGEAISKLRESKPYLFKPQLDPERLDEQLTEIRHAQEDGAIKKFVASKPSNEDLLKAISTGDFRC